MAAPGLGFALISSIKFHSAEFLAGHAWLTYGRVRPAAASAMLYGFCLQAGLGIGLWLLARLGRSVLAQRWLATLGAIFWNLGVTVGVLGILAGDRTGFETLDMPGYATPLVLIGYLVLGVWGALTFHRRPERRLFVSQWFVFAALFWFPWIFTTAQLLLVTFPVRGVLQAVIAGWYANNLQVVWLWLAGLGMVFYLVPRLTGRELESRYLAMTAFWLILLFGSWGGIANSAPVPAWMPALSTVGMVLTTVALLAVGISVWKTAISGSGRVCGGLALRFVLFGVAAFLAAGFMRVLASLLTVSRVTDLTWFGPATDQLNDYGFFAMVVFGAAYWTLPQVMGIEFPWPRLARAHFWLASVGIVLLAAPLAMAGLIEGFKLQNPDIPFMEIFKATLHGLRVSTLGELLMALGHVAFLANLAGLAARFCRVRALSAYTTLTADLFKPAEAKP